LKPALPITDVLIDFLGPRPETDRAPPIDAIRSRATAIYAYQRDLNVIIPREAVGEALCLARTAVDCPRNTARLV
jgi:hypothetical protein